LAASTHFSWQLPGPFKGVSSFYYRTSATSGSEKNRTYGSNAAVRPIGEEALAIEVGVCRAGGGQDSGEDREANHFGDVTCLQRR